MSRRTQVFALAAALALAAPAAADRLALVGGTVHTVSGATIEHATVLVDGAVITAVGPNVAVPPGTKVIDCSGQQVYPGFIAPNTVLGNTEISSVEGSNDTQETGNLNPNVRAEIQLNPDSDFLPVARINGVTSALVVPLGGVVRGTSALIHLDGWTFEDMAVRAPVGMHVAWPNMTPVRGFFVTQSDEEQAKARDERLAEIRNAFEDARAYVKAHAAEGTPGVPKHDADVRWQAMRKVLAGEIPVFIHANALNQIKSALQFADEQKLTNLVIVGGQDAWRIADELKRRDVAVITGPPLALPGRRWEPYDEGSALAAKLAAAGVRFCIGDGGGTFAAAMVRNLPYQAGMASRFGLPADEALKAITLYPAQILGVGDKLGSIEPGKIADLQVTSGDPLEITTTVRQVILNGKAIAMESRQTRLFEKYDHRPRGPKARPR